MPVPTKPIPKRPVRFDAAERAALDAALQKNTLWYLGSGKPDDAPVARTMQRYADRFGAYRAVSTSSGTASLHVAIAASQMPTGSEVIVTPITDIGTINAILYQNLIPVFADVDPDTAMPQAKHIEAAITEHTRGVVVVHLTGRPAEISDIAALCEAKGLVLIEDCAQALGATHKGKPLGQFGRFGCYSLNDQKHITCGEGGFVLTHNDDDYFLCHNYADKFFDRHGRGVRLHALAPNYRMSDLDGAMAEVQLAKLDQMVLPRRRLGDRLNDELAKIRGIIPQGRPLDGESSYFFFLFRIDSPGVIKCSRQVFRDQMLDLAGISSSGAYVPEPIYRSDYFLNKTFFPGRWPAEVVAGRTYDYRKVSLPGAETAVETGIRFILHEGFKDSDIDDYVAAVRMVAERNY
ncbi:DegT/DnrJ/EryC1/StrS family aminotransferase [Mesorhizobium intechi]|uniref:DegT/DnrJ/EryC1/StrS family aminotransferase n=1 Tax=Mesorhizobium intechi TaxID=537601 RepID=A0A8T9AX12_9HYPH|nr:DegT/DnrJ/EryC1/StrS family aminotransferase [Mesorhizobium intechi]TSE13546.1 DegT/DnrJ/EryC1/StrS family aminotransferase [Mesorhizobium intechi]